MEYSAQLRYSDSTVRAAVRGFWWRSTGWPFAASLVILGASLFYLVLHGDRSWTVGALGAAFLAGLAMPAAIYIVHLRNGRAKLRDMGLPTATLRATESEIAFESGAGAASLPWSAVGEVWQFPTFWLLVFSKAQFVTLPSADLSDSLRQFILDRVRASGGKVS